jgi:hypothetical protein
MLKHLSRHSIGSVIESWINELTLHLTPRVVVVVFVVDVVVFHVVVVVINDLDVFVDVVDVVVVFH